MGGVTTGGVATGGVGGLATGSRRSSAMTTRTWGRNTTSPSSALSTSIGPLDPDPSHYIFTQELFYQYVFGTRMPMLGDYGNGEQLSVVVVETTMHKGPRMCAAIEAAGAVLLYNVA